MSGRAVATASLLDSRLTTVAFYLGSSASLCFLVGHAELLFLFGGKKLPEMGKGIGEGIRNFKKSIKGDEPETGKENRA